MKKLFLVLILCFTLCVCGCSLGNLDNSSADSKDVTSEAISVDVSSEETSDELSSTVSEEISADISNEENSRESSEDVSSEDVSVDNTVTDHSLTEFLAAVKNDDNLVAVAHLGVCEGDFNAVKAHLEETGIYERYPFLSSVTKDSFFTGRGTELYAVLLLYEGATLEVSTQTIDDSTTDTDGVPLMKKEELCKINDAKPIIIRGNYSDIIPELCLTVATTYEVALEYSPHLSLENGMLGNNSHVGGVYDFTPYSLLGITTSEIVLNWYGQVQYDAGTRLALLLDFYDSGKVIYGYGPVEAGFIGKLEGNWTVDGDTLILDFNTLIDEEGESVSEFYGTFKYTVDGDKLTLVHTQGDSLIYTMKGGTFEFAPRLG